MLRTLILGAFLNMVALASPLAAQGQTFKDNDWNTAFKVSCGLPQPNSIERVTVGGDRKVRVTLREGDKGKCGTDNKARHRAPFWERAELSQVGKLQVGRSYRITSEVQFVKGFTGEREAFFQIHGWAPDCQKAYPPVMMKIHRGRMVVETLRGVSVISSGRHRNVLKSKVDVAALYGKAVQLAVDFDLKTRPARMSVSFAGRKLVTDAPVDFARCAQPFVKLGAYRPGGKGSGISQIVFDDLRVEQVD